jgi:nicotinate phosphoribosyltransferase
MASAAKTTTPCLPLFLDLYQIHMAAACHVNKMTQQTTCEVFVPELPPSRAFLVAAGIQPALERVRDLRFTAEDIDRLRSIDSLGDLPDDFFQFLESFEFTGSVWSVEEGTPVFAGEPLVRVQAAVIEIQLIETLLLSIIDFQTAVASKAARLVLAAGDRGVVELGGRRAHGPEAAHHAARASYIAGVRATSNVHAALDLGIPVMGTMGHEFVKVCASEAQAFKYYSRAFPEDALLLVDTVEAADATRQAVAFGESLHGVRIAADDVLGASREVREVLDDAKRKGTQIIASGELDEHRIAELVEQGAPIDLFGVGAELVTSRDAPSLDGVFRVVEIETKKGPRYPTGSVPGKRVYPGRKQVFRVLDPDGRAVEDRIVQAGEMPGEREEALLRKTMEDGRMVAQPLDLADVRRRCLDRVGSLPEPVLRLRDAGVYPVGYSERLEELNRTVLEQE